MRICLDVSAAVHRRAGMGRYAEELVAALVAIDPQNEYVIFHNLPATAPVSPPLDRLPRLPIRLPDKPWRMSVFLAQLTHVSQDRLFPGIACFHATDHLLPRLVRVKSVFTVHDLTFRLYSNTHTPLHRWFLNLMMPRFLAAADMVVAVSECTKRDIVRLYGLDETKIRVVHEGVHARFHPVRDRERLGAIRRRYRLPARFLLFVGTIEPRKNLVTLFEAFRQARLSDVKLVIAGSRGWRCREVFERLRTLGLARHVMFTGFVPDEDLPGLYTLAEAFVFPTLYEGFGLPLLEAMACGTPVISSNTSSLPEVAGGAAMLVAPHDVCGWIAGLVAITQKAALRAELRQRGLRRAAGFTWESAAFEMREVYRALCP